MSISPEDGLRSNDNAKREPLGTSIVKRGDVLELLFVVTEFWKRMCIVKTYRKTKPQRKEIEISWIVSSESISVLEEL